MKTIAVYYIATSLYCDLFTHFLDSLKNFLPDCKKHVVLITDGLEYYSNYKDELNNIYIDRRLISHFPWPVVTLYKHWLIYTNKIECDYCVYFNANTIIKKLCTIDNFDINKINLTLHSIFSGNDSTVEIANKFNFNCSVHSPHYKYLEENKNSNYCQGAFFFGPSDLFYSMCLDIINMINADLNLNFSILRWHDESYLNVWAIKNPNQVIYKQFASAYDNTNHLFFLKDCKKINKGSNLITNKNVKS